MNKISLFQGQKFAISEFSRHIEYDFLKEEHKTNFHTKIRKFYSSVWKLKARNLQNCQFWPKMAKFWPQMTKFWPSQNFPGIYPMIFSKKTTRVVSIPKIMKIYSGVWKIQAKTLKNGYFGQKWPYFDHFWPFWGSINFSAEKIFGGHLSHMDTQLHAQNQKRITVFGQN